MVDLKKGLIIYLLAEIIVIAVFYLLITLGNDFIFELLGSLLVLSVIIGIFFATAAIVFRLRNKIDRPLFITCFLLSCLGILLPFVFFIFLLSQMH